MVINMDSDAEEMVVASTGDALLGNEDIASKLLAKIASSESAHFKSQQRGDPDLTFEEKRTIAGSILEKGPQHFLARFHKHLNSEDMTYFEQFRGTYEIDFYINEVNEASSKSAKIRVKNRRYEALKKLVSEGKYFSLSEMKGRNPLMFEQLVGQYMDEEEMDELNKIDTADLRFTTILMEHIDRDYEKSRRQQQEEEMFEESEEDDDDYNIPYTVGAQTQIIDPKLVSKEEKAILKEEFLSNMYQSFLDGHDVEFNYSSVDNNAEYDSFTTNQQDAEDSYFDAEEPKEPENQQCYAEDLS